MKVVLDTNILLVSIPTRSKYRPIFDALIGGAFTLSLSNEILSEYREIIARKTTAVIANNVAELLLSLVNVELVNIYFRWNLVDQDPDDNKFVDCAIASNADFIVSNDQHFQHVTSLSFPKIEVIGASNFLEFLHSRS